MAIALKCRASGWIFAVIGLVAAAVIPESPCPRLVYNPSRSVAVGFYWITPTAGPRVGELVLMQTPASVAELADKRRYLPRHVPMIKYVAALSGDRVCALGDIITIDGKRVAKRLMRDHSGRPMPWWNGCRTLRSGDLFVLNRNAPLSFDGRYFGIVPTRLIRGRARRL